MKKTSQRTVRNHRSNNSAKTQTPKGQGRAKQAVTFPPFEKLPQFAPVPGRAPDAAIDHPSCIAIYDRLAKGVVTQIPFGEDEFYTLTRHTCSLESNDPAAVMPTFIAQAIREKLAASTAKDGTGSKLPSAFQIYELGSELDKAFVLARSLVNFLQQWEVEGIQPSLVDGERTVIVYDNLLHDVEESVYSKHQALLDAVLQGSGVSSPENAQAGEGRAA